MSETALQPKTGADQIAERLEFAFSPEQVRSLVRQNIVPKGTPNSDIELYLRTCQARGLNPFLRQAYLLPFNKNIGTRQNPQWATSYTLVIGVDGARMLADKTGQYAGQDEPLFNDGKTEFEMLSSSEEIVTATVKIYRIVHGIRVSYTATAAWKSYLPAKETKRKMWNKFPHLMISKCAEMLAFRKGFPAAFGGIHFEGEMHQANNEWVDLGAAEQAEKEAAIAEVKAAKTSKEVKDICAKHAMFMGDTDFIAAQAEMYERFGEL